MDNRDLWALGKIMNTMCDKGGDRGASFPESDVKDLEMGARYIPGEVTLARRRGEKVHFDPAAHKWTMPDGTVIS